MQRDFTYISDIVDCVILALSHTPVSCNEVYNVGRGQPEELQTLLNYLEKALSQKATLVSELTYSNWTPCISSVGGAASSTIRAAIDSS